MREIARTNPLKTLRGAVFQAVDEAEPRPDLVDRAGLVVDEAGIEADRLGVLESQVGGDTRSLLRIRDPQAAVVRERLHRSREPLPEVGLALHEKHDDVLATRRPRRDRDVGGHRVHQLFEIVGRSQVRDLVAVLDPELLWQRGARVSGRLTLLRGHPAIIAPRGSVQTSRMQSEPPLPDDVADDEAEVADPPRPPWRWVDVFLAIIGGLVVSVLAGGVLFSLGIEELDSTIKFFITGAVVYLSFLASFWYFALVRHGASRRDLEIGPVSLSSIPALIGITLATLFVGGIVTSTVQSLMGREVGQAEQEVFIGTPGPGDYVVMLMFVVVLGPIVEELIFRGFLWDRLAARFSVTVTLIVTSIAFSVIHFIPVLMPTLFLFGLSFGYVRHRYSNLSAAIVVHSLVNLVALTVSYLVLRA